MAIRVGLLGEVVAMAFDTVRTNKMRSGLTVLGVVIGITSIVGMTAMIRGFDESLRDIDPRDRPEHHHHPALRPAELRERRRVHRAHASGPNLTVSDARAIEEQAPIDPARRHPARAPAAGAADPGARLLPRPADATAHRLRHDRELRRRARSSTLDAGRFFTGTEVQHRSNVVVLGQTPYQALFDAAGTDPIGKMVRVGAERYTVVGVFDKRPGVGGFNAGQDDFVVIPYTVYQRQFGTARHHRRPRRATRRDCVPIQIAARAARGRRRRRTRSPTSQRVMRIRHGLRLDEPDDFDIATQDAILAALGSDQPGDVPGARS